MVDYSFNAFNVPPDMSGVIPEGWYTVSIHKSELIPSLLDPDCYSLLFILSVLDGKYAEKILYNRLHIKNKSPMASDRAAAELSVICHVTGVFSLTNTSELHNKPFFAYIKVQPERVGSNGQTYATQNVFYQYKDMSGRTPNEIAESCNSQPQQGYIQPQPQQANHQYTQPQQGYNQPQPWVNEPPQPGNEPDYEPAPWVTPKQDAVKDDQPIAGPEALTKLPDDGIPF